MTSTTPLENLPTRERLLQAALTCFSRKGYHQTTTDEIVAESGMGKGTLYRYFGTKQELFAALVEWVMSGLSDEVDHLDLAGLSAADQLRTVVRALLDDMERLLPFFRITLDYWAQTTEDEQVRAMFRAALADFQAQLAPIIEAGVASGEFRPVNAPQAVLFLIAALDGLGLYKALLNDDIDLAATVETSLDIFVAGLQRKAD